MTKPASETDLYTPPEIRKMREMLREAKPAFDQKFAEDLLKEVLPIVEKITGRTFKKTPKVQTASRKVVSEALYHDLLPQLKILLPNASEKKVEQTTRAQAFGMAPLLLGKYGFEDKILYVLPGNFLPLLTLADIDAKYLKPIAMLIVAHELVHALQDQETDLVSQLEHMKSQEEALSISSVIEGHAMLVMERVGKEMKLDERYHKAIVDLAGLYSKL